MILGLDISTSILGYTILDDDGKIVVCDCIDMRKVDGDILVKGKIVEEKFTELSQQYSITNVFIEQSLQAFRPGLSSAAVILLLGKFNGIVSWLASKIFGMYPEFIGATTARKAVGIKVPKGENSKEVVLKHILDSVPEFVVQYTPKGNPKQGTFDRADSWVIAYSGYLSCMKKES
jgi:Holliday junction resolvasome RuvABC endonuclease subunit